MGETVVVRPMSWQDTLGRGYTGQFFPAVGGGRRPAPLVIIYYQCAGFLRGGLGDEWPLASLARNGIAALCINAPPLQETAIERFEQGRLGIESAVDRLASLGEVDPARVGLAGLSFGAEVAFWTAMNSQVARVLSVSTPVISPNLTLQLSLWEEVYLSRLRRYWQLGTPDETPQGWQTLSPAFEPERVQVPVLMQMSEQEYRSSLDYAVPLIRMCRAEVYVFPNEPHQKYLPRHKLAVYERNLDWFRFWLMGQESDGPAGTTRYARWRQIRRSSPHAPPLADLAPETAAGSSSRTCTAGKHG